MKNGEGDVNQRLETEDCRDLSCLPLLCIHVFRRLSHLEQAAVIIYFLSDPEG